METISIIKGTQCSKIGKKPYIWFETITSKVFRANKNFTSQAPLGGGYIFIFFNVLILVFEGLSV